MRITFEGHACFQITAASGLTILTDPYLSGNSLAQKQPADFKPDLVLVSHGHDDHVGDALEICEKSGATLAGPVELLGLLAGEGFDKVAFNMGGCFRHREAHIIMTPAWHGSQYKGRYAGLACGYIVELDGKTIYFAGDTGLFGDMSTVIGRYKIDYAMLPIGDFYTMGPDDAVTAAHWLRPQTVIPMHFNTFPVIQQDVQKFKAALEDRTDSKCLILAPGESHEF